MSAPYRQDKRIGELFTPLGDDKLVLVEFSGVEAMSELFRFEVSAICDEDEGGPLDFDKSLGKNCTVRLDTPTFGPRHFCGTLTEAERVGPVLGGTLYKLVLRPWFWMLTQRVNSFVFEDKTPEEIIDTVLKRHGFAEVDNRASQTGVTLEYCVQHRESDFHFVCRLLERHGIAYHFEFENDKQTMVLTNDRSGYRVVPGGSRSFHPDERLRQDREENLHTWQARRQFVSGKVKLNDYNYTMSGSELVVDKQAESNYENSKLEVYHYPGQFAKEGEGLGYAEAAVDALQSQDKRYVAEGNCMGLSAGLTLKLEKHADAGEYLVLRAEHHLISENYRSTGSAGGEAYQGRYQFMSTDRRFAPAQLTPRPFISGPQTAVVITEPGDDPDKYGRVKVRFDWHTGDSEGESMWCRVAQVWVGQEWGAQFIPHLGMEALVQFMDGDPDRPVIVGTVPNDEHKLPYADEANLSGWVTRTDNEIRFDDTPSEELVRVYGIRDIEIEAEHQITLKVGNSTIVIDQQSITIKSTTITMDAEATLTAKAGADLTTESKGTASHKASAILIVQGSLVKIN